MKTILVLALLAAAVNCAHCMSLRIVSGQEAEVGEAPFIVLFNNGSLYCAGSIIHPNWVVTAAHCLVQEDVTLYAGLHSREAFDEPQVQKRRVASRTSFIVHELFSDELNSVDIGLVYVSEPFDLESSPRVKSISLPNKDLEYNREVKVYGWGITSDYSVATNLQVFKDNYITYEECKPLYFEIVELKPYHMCTKTTGGSCLHDSGGPMVRQTSEGVELAGIVNWGKSPCQQRNLPPVYLNIDDLKKWIEFSIDKYSPVPEEE